MLRGIDFLLNICNWFLACFTGGMKLLEHSYVQVWIIAKRWKQSPVGLFVGKPTENLELQIFIILCFFHVCKAQCSVKGLFSRLCQISTHHCNCCFSALTGSVQLMQIETILSTPEIVLHPPASEVYKLTVQSVRECVESSKYFIRWMAGERQEWTANLFLTFATNELSV